MITTIKTLLAAAGCTFVAYENDQMVNVTIEPSTVDDIIGVVVEQSRVTFKTASNGVRSTNPTIIIEILKKIGAEQTAEQNLTALEQTKNVAEEFIHGVIMSGYFKRVTDVEGIKIIERKYDANVIGWSLAMPLTLIENRNACIPYTPIMALLAAISCAANDICVAIWGKFT